MTKSELNQKLEKGEDMLLLDIREPEEHKDTATIVGSVAMPMGKVFTEAVKGNLPKDRPIVLFCKSGRRAAVTATELNQLGYPAHPLEGGLDDYK